MTKCIQDDEIAVFNMKHLRQKCEELNCTWEELSEEAGCSPEELTDYTNTAGITPVKVYEELGLLMGWEEYCSGRHKSFQTSEICANDIQKSANSNVDSKASDTEAVEPTTENVRHKRHDDVKTYVRFVKERRDALETIAMLEGTTMSDIINTLVSEYLASYNLTIEAVTSLRKRLRNDV